MEYIEESCVPNFNMTSWKVLNPAVILTVGGSFNTTYDSLHGQTLKSALFYNKNHILLISIYDLNQF